MGERAHKVVIRSGQVKLFRSQWGGRTCAGELAGEGAGAFLEEYLGYHECCDGWMDNSFMEGGYLVDFDHKVILLYS
jgi:hypothetical protein